MPKKRGPGRPALGRKAATETVRLRLAPADARRWRAAKRSSDFKTLSEMIRAAVEAFIE